MIDDQAAIARAALALHEATGDPAYQAQAEALVAATDAAFADGHGGFYTTAVDAADVPVGRPRTAADNAAPAGNGQMAEVCARLFHLTGEDRWRARAENILRAFAGLPEQFATMPTILAAADTLAEGTSAVITGEPADWRTAALLRAALGAADPAVVVLQAAPSRVLPPGHPAHGKTGAEPAAYVCRGNVCGLPVSDPAALAALLAVRR